MLLPVFDGEGSPKFRRSFTFSIDSGSGKRDVQLTAGRLESELRRTRQDANDARANALGSAQDQFMWKEDY